MPPTKIKAQAIALLILGRSCREARAELHQLFPGDSIPHYSTIARWFQKMAEPQSKGVNTRWHGASSSRKRGVVPSTAMAAVQEGSF